MIRFVNVCSSKVLISVVRVTINQGGLLSVYRITCIRIILDMLKDHPHRIGILSVREY